MICLEIENAALAYLHYERTRREALADLVECFARVRARVLRKYFRNFKDVLVAAAGVDEVLRRLYFFLVVEPNHVVPAIVWAFFSSISFNIFIILLRR